MIDLREADIEHYRRFAQSELAYIDIDAEPWVPKWDIPQLSTDDTRRLGVRLVAVRSNGRTLSVLP
jgi:hypothetical protein